MLGDDSLLVQVEEELRQELADLVSEQEDAAERHASEIANLQGSMLSLA